jgi:hypothetical protein
MNMSRFTPYLGIVAAVLLFAFITVFSNSVTVERAPTITTNASSTVAVVPNPTLPQLTLPDIVPNTSPTTSVAPIKKAKSPAPVPIPIASPAPTVQPAPATPAPSSDASLNASASVLRAALVNIVCYASAGSNLHSILGSGVFIDSNGIILTNAHVAQYFLLADRGSSCTIRSGSPASDSYDAALIYISPLWLRANAGVLTQSNPMGTGEYDFALLAVTKSATANPLPASFPSIPLAANPPPAATPVVIASYGAQFLESNQIQSALFPTVVFGSVKDVFTFGTNTIDVLALGGSAAAQEGSSGGGVSDASGSLVGTITTSTISGDTSTRALDAITASYIRAEFASEMGSAIDLLLAQPVSTSVSEFAPKIPTLESILTAHLP